MEGRVTGTVTTVATIDGIKIAGSCNSGSAPIFLEAQSGNDLAFFGIRGREATVSSAGGSQITAVASGAGSADNQIHFLARNEAVDMAWQEFDLHLDTGDCILSGTVTPSE